VKSFSSDLAFEVTDDEEFTASAEKIRAGVDGSVNPSSRAPRGAWSVRTVSRQLLTCTSTEFRLHPQLDAYEGDHRVHSDNSSIAAPRDLL
jgi:uncharacterized protein